MADEPIYLDGSVESAMRASRAMARFEVSGDTLDDYARVLRENEALTRRAEQAESAVERLRAALDEAYADRNLVVQAFAESMESGGWPVAWGVDPSEPDWPVLYIETPHGQVSWHIPKAERIYEPTDRSGSFGPVKWDGHTNADKADRLRAALDPATSEGERDG